MLLALMGVERRVGFRVIVGRDIPNHSVSMVPAVSTALLPIFAEVWAVLLNSPVEPLHVDRESSLTELSSAQLPKASRATLLLVSDWQMQHKGDHKMKARLKVSQSLE